MLKKIWSTHFSFHKTPGPAFHYKFLWFCTIFLKFCKELLGSLLQNKKNWHQTTKRFPLHSGLNKTFVFQITFSFSPLHPFLSFHPVPPCHPELVSGSQTLIIPDLFSVLPSLRGISYEVGNNLSKAKNLTISHLYIIIGKKNFEP